MQYSKKKQTKKSQITRKRCTKCNQVRKIKFFSSPRAYVCNDCKRKSRRLKKQSSKRHLIIQKDKELRAQILIRDNYTCQRCGKKLEGRNCHLSHVLPKGKYPELRHDPNNVKILCYHCHIQFWHKNPIEAMQWFKSTFPERYEYLMKHIKS